MGRVLWAVGIRGAGFDWKSFDFSGESEGVAVAMQAWGAGGVGLRVYFKSVLLLSPRALGFTSCVVEELCLQSLFAASLHPVFMLVSFRRWVDISHGYIPKLIHPKPCFRGSNFRFIRILCEHTALQSRALGSGEHIVKLSVMILDPTQDLIVTFIATHTGAL